MFNIAKQIKDQTDSILRRRQTAPGSSVTVRGGTTEPGTGPGTPPEIVEPNSGLAAHKTSADHDGRYYTEAEVDAMLNFVGLSDTPAAYTGEGGKVVAVKADVSGLEFVAAPAATNGVPAGGTTNQLAAKNSNADYDIKWMNAPAAANGIPAGGVLGQILAKVDEDDYNAQWIDAPSGGGGGGGDLIGEIILAADSDPIEFTNIPQTYASLYLEVTGRSMAAGTGVAHVEVQVGNAAFDTGSNYSYRAYDSTSTTSSYSDTKMLIGRACLPQAGSTAGASGACKVTFFDYANTNFWKTARGESTTFHTGGKEMRWGMSSCGWKSTSAIERIKIVTGMAANSIIRLWGIPK